MSKVNKQSINETIIFLTKCWPIFHIPVFCRENYQTNLYPYCSVARIIATNHIQIAMSSKPSHEIISRLFCRASYRNISYTDCSVEQTNATLHIQIVPSGRWSIFLYTNCSAEEMIATNHIQIVLSRKPSQQIISRWFCRGNDRIFSYSDCSVEEMIAAIHIQIVQSRKWL